jgi:hypothetical protein
MTTPRDHAARSAEIPDDIVPFDPTTITRARHTVYANTSTLQECADLWRMLGIMPGQEVAT